MVSSEAAPYAKTGGLADVVGAVPAALQELGDEVAVVLPRYASIDLKAARRVWENLRIHLGLGGFDVTIYQAAAPYPVYLIDCPLLFDRKALYGEGGHDYPDNHVRFALFSKAALAVARHLFRPDIFHCHDWQAGLVPAYLRSTFAGDPTFMGCRTVFTIHNLGYQGLFPITAMPEVSINGTLLTPAGMEYWGRVSYLKAGLVFSDALTTVSPTYAREIQTPEMGFGLDGVLRARANVLTGILNGVDYNEWSPEVDPHIPARYSASDLSGKQTCKRQLLEEFGLPAAAAMKRPLLGIVSRLSSQKGADLIAQAAAQILAQDVYLVALGAGDREYEDFFRRMQQEHPSRISARIGFDNALAHRIEAGTDMFLMPSKYEPCGLNQIYSLRYGTPPVVRATGGLDDTIEADTGFKFAEYSPLACLEALRSAIRAYGNPDARRRMMRSGMQKDYSWKRSAAQYFALYQRLLGRG